MNQLFFTGNYRILVKKSEHLDCLVKSASMFFYGLKRLFKLSKFPVLILKRQKVIRSEGVVMVVGQLMK